MITFSSFYFVFRTKHFEAELCDTFVKLSYFVIHIVHGRIFIINVQWFYDICMVINFLPNASFLRTIPLDKKRRPVH